MLLAILKAYKNARFQLFFLRLGNPSKVMKNYRTESVFNRRNNTQS